jgi:AraC-like DNA-binding protein
VPLRGLIGWYSGYRQQGVPPARHRGLPSPYLTLIITLDDPLTVARHPDPADRPGDYRTLVGGLHTTPALISHPGRQSGVQVQLSPLGARALLGLPAGELAGRDLAADDVLGGVAAELHERMRAAADWPARFAILDEVLLARADLDQQVSPDIAEAWRLLVRSGGQVRAAELAGHVGWSPRYLQQRLRTETGLTPKAAARVTRFDRARRILQRQAASGAASGGAASVSGSAAAAGGAASTSASGGAVVTLADVAAGCGYYDQAHLAREFRALAGCPPATWLADEFRNVQSSAGDLDGDWLT